MPYEPDDQYQEEANVVDISGGDADELGAKIGGAIGGGFNPGWFIPGYGSGMGGGIGQIGNPFNMWVTNNVFYIRIGGTTYSCPWSSLDYWTVCMIISLMEQWNKYQRT